MKVYSLLKSITIRPATSPRFNCCTLSANLLSPRTSQILCSSPRRAYSSAAAASCISPTIEPVMVSFSAANINGLAPTVTLASVGGRPMQVMMPPIRPPM